MKELQLNREYSGVELKFNHGVGGIDIWVRDEDGILATNCQSFAPQDVALVTGGDDGSLTPHGRPTLKGVVQFLSERPVRLADILPERYPLEGLLPGPDGEEPEGIFPSNDPYGKAPVADPAVLPPPLRDASGHSYPPGYAAQVLDTVRARGGEYGTPADNHQLTADLFGAWLNRRFGTSLRFDAEAVVIFNVFQKLSRLAYASKDDSYLDICGYVENISMLRPEQRRK